MSRKMSFGRQTFSLIFFSKIALSSRAIYHNLRGEVEVRPDGLFFLKKSISDLDVGQKVRCSGYKLIKTIFHPPPSTV